MGRHFLQIPGPTNVPDRVLRAIEAPTIDHRGPAFARPAARSSTACGEHTAEVLREAGFAEAEIAAL